MMSQGVQQNCVLYCRCQMTSLQIMIHNLWHYLVNSEKTNPFLSLAYSSTVSPMRSECCVPSSWTIRNTKLLCNESGDHLRADRTFIATNDVTQRAAPAVWKGGGARLIVRAEQPSVGVTGTWLCLLSWNLTVVPTSISVLKSEPIYCELKSSGVFIRPFNRPAEFPLTIQVRLFIEIIIIIIITGFKL